MGVFFLADNAGVGCANWVLRAFADDIGEALRENGHGEVADWLTSETSPVRLYADLDVRCLTQQNQHAFLDAIAPACARAKERGTEGWGDPSAFPGYISLFENLAHQVQLLSKGEIPKELPYLNGVSPHSGEKLGPGWEAEEDVA